MVELAGQRAEAESGPRRLEAESREPLTTATLEDGSPAESRPRTTALCTRCSSWRRRTHRAHRPGSWRGWRGTETVWCDPRAISPPAPAGGGGIPGEEGDPWGTMEKKDTERKTRNKTEGRRRGYCFGRSFCHVRWSKERGDVEYTKTRGFNPTGFHRAHAGKTQEHMDRRLGPTNTN